MGRGMDLPAAAPTAHTVSSPCQHRDDPWWHQSNGPDDYRIRELLRAVWDLHALYGQGTWLWRGQPNYGHDLTAGVHTRVMAGGLTDDRVKGCTIDLIDAGSAAQLDLHEGTRLSDLALLAMLQHHGADASSGPIPRSAGGPLHGGRQSKPR